MMTWNGSITGGSGGESPENVYEMAGRLSKPMALRAHVNITVKRASRALSQQGVDAALAVILAAMPRFDRLGGIELLLELERAAKAKDPNRPLPRRLS